MSVIKYSQDEVKNIIIDVFFWPNKKIIYQLFIQCLLNVHELCSLEIFQNCIIYLIRRGCSFWGKFRPGWAD
jgi:hypothetical protein